MCRPLALRNSTPTRFWTSRPFLCKVTTRFRCKVGPSLFVDGDEAEGTNGGHNERRGTPQKRRVRKPYTNRTPYKKEARKRPPKTSVSHSGANWCS